MATANHIEKYFSEQVCDIFEKNKVDFIILKEHITLPEQRKQKKKAKKKKLLNLIVQGPMPKKNKFGRSWLFVHKNQHKEKASIIK